MSIELNTENIISVDGLTKFYGTALGVKDVSFQVMKGEMFGFLGPNGAGKTTTIRILLDLLRPSSGSVTIFGKRLPLHSIEIRKKTGYLPGEFAAYHQLKAIEFLKLSAKLRKMVFNADSNLFSRFELSKRDLHKKIKELSHGNLQKIGIIQALIHKPDLLILDEPTTGLDPLMKEVFYELMKEEQKRGTTIFFSSHNLDEVERLCERVGIIRKGSLVSLEYVEKLKEKAGQILELKTKAYIDKLELPHAQLISHQGDYYKFRVSGDWQPVINRLAELPVKDISITRPGLEDLFMQYYKNEKIS